MKYYYIDKYVNYYQQNNLIYTDRISREIVPDLETGKRILANIKPKYMENKHYISMYEGYKLTYKDDYNYKFYYNEMTPEGVIKNV